MTRLMYFMQWLDRSFRTGLFCNHSRTRPSEGKCYCPDCGSGVIFEWVVLRCSGCNVRRDSRYFLRRLVPVDRCCTRCGESAYRADTLEAPSYFQLQKACLVIRSEEEYMRDRFDWLNATIARAVETPMTGNLLQTMSDSLSRRRPWGWPAPQYSPVLARIP